MATVILDQHLAESLIAERKRLGQDRYDEVWEGIYRMAPAPNTLHARIVSYLSAFFQSGIDAKGLGQVLIGINVSDRVKAWDKNYRIPDLSVILNGGIAEDRDTFWLSGPDFVVEVCSPDEDPHEKIDFYESVGVREMLVINRATWKIELFRLTGDKLSLASECDPASEIVSSDVIPFEFHFESGDERPVLIVRNTISGEIRRI
jgi:Uma2 family endonuclease